MFHEHTVVPPLTARPRWLQLAGYREVFGIDLRTLALFRVGLAALILADLLLRARDLRAHYTDFGIFPRSDLVGYLSPGSFSLHLANGSVWFQALLFAVAGLFAVMLLVGYRSRIAVIVSWVLLLSLQNRNPMILSGEDNLLVLLAFWGMFLPLGARFSVDAALNSEPRAASNGYFSLATLALLVQGMSMYLFSALLKSDARWIPDGTAVHYALQLDYFVTPFALWFRQFEPVLQGLTYYVWCVELIGPILIFSPLFHRQLRALFLVVFITMHIGFFLCLEIGLFPFVSILMNLTFVPGWTWDRLGAAGAAGHRGTRIYYDGDCGFCRKTCRLLTTFLCLGDVPIRPAQSSPKPHRLLQQHNSWVVRDRDGVYEIRWEAMRSLVAASPWLWPAARLLVVAALRRHGDRVYQWVSDNRAGLGVLTARVLPYRPVRLKLGLLGSACVAVLAGFVFVQNLTTLPQVPYRLPDGLLALRQALGLYQNWTMFAPYPELTSPWPAIVGELRDGTAVDVYNRRVGPPDWRKPRYVSKTYANYRWRKYLSILEDMSYGDAEPDFARNYARYLCRLWNEDTAPDKQLRLFQIYFNVEWSPPDDRAKPVTKRLVWSHDCFG